MFPVSEWKVSVTRAYHLVFRSLAGLVAHVRKAPRVEDIRVRVITAIVVSGIPARGDMRSLRQECPVRECVVYAGLAI